MRIKKIAPVTPANGNIKNSYGTSQTDTYSQEYINDLQPKLLWTNSNINVEFLAQDISITDLSTYSYYEIIYKQHATTQNYLQSSGKISIGQNAYLGGGILRKSAAPRFWARFVDYSSTKLTFSAGYYETTSDSSAGTANDIIIPVQIIGYK